VNDIQVVVIEREPIYRKGLVAVLVSATDIDVVGSADTVDEAHRLTDESQPNVAVVGTTVTEPSGLELATELRRRHPAIAIVVIAADESDDELFGAIRAGASAYTGRAVSEEILCDLIRRSAKGEYIINEQLLSKPYVAARVLDQFRSNLIGVTGFSEAFMPLTNRELEILRRVSDGMTNAAIGDALGISTQTVKNHVTSILRKLAVNDRTQAVVTAFRRGWLTLGEESSVDSTTWGGTNTPTSHPGSDGSGRPSG